ncbi:ADP-ribosylglycohydrolase family protein [Opacimonas viscosa]|uniref:ADP-ribosylglycohydrolase family protein n=1 Tax=Opacimonas viscosa TaxID=2961944 RepID=A0AA41X006_9ALTE|nr:ADP-ribosylglycohydrolase family protein [Opacimonas viscosa]MCP3429627.1 ADP-ribosylglycohydrolase family protein [Opacimonas viscosa]
MTDLVALSFKEEALKSMNIPVQEYFLPKQILNASLQGPGSIPRELLLYGLQLMISEKGFNYKGQYFASLDAHNSPVETGFENSDWHRMQFVGCLLGGAIGDAFGAPVEFMKRSAILQQYGNNGIEDFAEAYGKVGAITDDTQMTLFTTEGLLRAWVKGCFTGVTSELGCIGHAYQRWYQTQGHTSPRNLDVTTDGYLWEQTELHSQRAPGNTCLSALAEMTSFTAPAQNNSKGCGGVMRVAPIGLYCWRLKNQFTVEDCFALGADAARLTHGHPTGYLASGAFAAIIYQILDGCSLASACMSVLDILGKMRCHDETTLKIATAIKLSRDPMPSYRAIEYLGEGWIAEEALAISIYCVLQASSFKELMSMSVSHDGDSDSTGAIAGNIWGALYGFRDFPTQWVENVELEDRINEIACDLYDFPLWDIGADSQNTDLNNIAQTRYPGT